MTLSENRNNRDIFLHPPPHINELFMSVEISFFFRSEMSDDRPATTSSLYDSRLLDADIAITTIVRGCAAR